MTLSRSARMSRGEALWDREIEPVVGEAMGKWKGARLLIFLELAELTSRY